MSRPDMPGPGDTFHHAVLATEADIDADGHDGIVVYLCRVRDAVLARRNALVEHGVAENLPWSTSVTRSTT